MILLRWRKMKIFTEKRATKIIMRWQKCGNLAYEKNKQQMRMKKKSENAGLIKVQ
jgi:hypothetical protein